MNNTTFSIFQSSSQSIPLPDYVNASESHSNRESVQKGHDPSLRLLQEQWKGQAICQLTQQKHLSGVVEHASVQNLPCQRLRQSYGDVSWFLFLLLMFRMGDRTDIVARLGWFTLLQLGLDVGNWSWYSVDLAGLGLARSGWLFWTWLI